MVGTLYEIWGTNQLGMGVVSKAESGAFAGVWAAEFVLGAVSYPK